MPHTEKNNTINLDKNLTFLSAIFEISQRITTSCDIDKLLQFILDTVVDNIGAVAGSLMLHDEKTGLLTIASAKGIEKEKIEKIKVTPGEGIAGKVFESGKPILLNGEVTKNNVRFKQKISSAMCVPVLLKEKKVGVLNLSRLDNSNPFLKNDLTLATFIANQISIAIENAKLLSEKNNSINSLNRLNTEVRDAYDKLKDSNKQLKLLQSQLIQSEKMSSLGQLAAGVAHEINNPIGFVKSNFQALSDYINDIKQVFDEYDSIVLSFNPPSGKSNDFPMKKIEDVKKNIDIPFMFEEVNTIIKESIEGVERVAKIVYNLKNFSRVDQADEEEFDINIGLTCCLELLKNEISDPLSVVTEFGDIPAIECYPQELNQVFMNIITNAVQSLKDKGTITIRTKTVKKADITQKQADGFTVLPMEYLEQDRSANDFLEISVIDTGSGISKENLQKIFDPFFSTKDIGKGTGLGLSASFGIIKKHNGYIGVKSVTREGTTFVIYLPFS